MELLFQERLLGQSDKVKARMGFIVKGDHNGTAGPHDAGQFGQPLVLGVKAQMGEHRQSHTASKCASGKSSGGVTWFCANVPGRLRAPAHEPRIVINTI